MWGGFVCLCVCVVFVIERERERDRDRRAVCVPESSKGERKKEQVRLTCPHMGPLRILHIQLSREEEKEKAVNLCHVSHH